LDTVHTSSLREVNIKKELQHYGSIHRTCL
jgi:hypothetical protein